MFQRYDSYITACSVLFLLNRQVKELVTEWRRKAPVKNKRDEVSK